MPMEKQPQLPFLAPGVESNESSQCGQWTNLPEGFVYRPEVFTGAEQNELLDNISALQFRPVDFPGVPRQAQSSGFWLPL